LNSISETFGWVAYILLCCIIESSMCLLISYTIHCFVDETLIINKKRIFWTIALISTSTIMVCSGINPLVKLYSVFITNTDWLTDPTEGEFAIFLFLSNFVGVILVILCPVLQKHIGAKKTVFRIIMSVAFYYLYSAIEEALLVIIYYIANRTDYYDVDWRYVEKETVLIQFSIIASINMLLFCLVFFAFYKKQKCIHLQKIDLVAIIAYYFILNIVCQTLLALSDNTIQLNDDKTKLNIILPLSLLLIIIVIPALILLNRFKSSYKKLTDYQQNFLEIELNASKQYKAAQADTRAFRHDIQNNLSVVTTLMQDGRINEAEQYLNDMRTKINSLSPKVVSGDDMVDSLISSKLPKMSEKGITFSTEGVIEGGLDWKPMDICTVFANMIDNAIEAASQTEDGFIRMEFKKTGHQRLIRAYNSCAEDVDCEKILSGGGHITSKEDKTLHGYGISNIRKTVEKYGGMMKISCAEKIFTMDIVLMQ